jgi:hypothetical protein
MRQRLVGLCLLAYPRARRAADRDYLRDLALDLAEAQGFLRQVLSLLGGGLRERIELRRRSPAAGLRRWVQRTVAASSVLVALAFAASGLIVSGSGDGEGVSEVERLVCQYAEDAALQRHSAPITGRSGCGETERLIAARERAGWECTTRRRVHARGRTTTWRCTRASDVVAWLGI